MTRTRFAARALTIASLLAACGMRGAKQEPPPSGETFGADDTYSRTYEVSQAAACESARRALLGQGYVIAKTGADAVEANKNFQPDAETHTQLNVRVTCVPQDDSHAIVFVNAVQDRYALKTTSNSASVGVGMIGSVSLPVGSSGASLVRVASNTVQNVDFYKRFFDRVKYYLPAAPGEQSAPPPAPEPTTPPDPPPAPKPAGG
ncbi:DUF2242 domain-containing protein [Luteimonas sp. SX5]|uniref:DUF2242 domain-containing protein n=1 Tax=Luteimonas galliterrae TaxID=2940486 RepID=A0ABT0MIS2_9GAMM|nr:DUF2242 domain-containing protein [Luteimonas galliterrae]MCL1634782.1 DUF2242 domain-containing protein [Luteimonas galliterrae]